MTKECSLSLKWGTLKSWCFTGNEKAIELFKKYCALGSSVSCMAQNDTEEQKQIICQLIDLMPSDICLDWTGEYVSKEKAKEYVLQYGKKDNHKHVC